MKRPVSREYPLSHLINFDHKYKQSWETDITETFKIAAEKVKAKKKRVVRVK